MNKLSANKLKLIALISMTIDHVGRMFFPSLIIFEIIGRLSFPIFAYMIAEGWKYTSNRKRYISTILGMGILYQIVYYIFYSSLYMGIFITYGLSLLFIFAIEYLLNKKKFCYLISPLIVFGVTFICCIEYIFPYTGYAIDYGLIGVFVPVVVYFSGTKQEKLSFLFLILCVHIYINGLIQIFSLLSIAILTLYNGKRGNKNLKYFFYVYYPLHLVVIWLINLFV